MKMEDLVPTGFCADLVELASQNAEARVGVPLEDPSLLSASSMFDTAPPEVEQVDSDSDDPDQDPGLS